MKLKILFFLIFFFSCRQEISPTNVLPLHFKRSLSISFNDKLARGNLTSLNRPSNTWIELASGNFQSYKVCLTYKTPFRKKSGVLMLSRKSIDSSCFGKGHSLYQFEVSHLSGVWSNESKIYLGEERTIIHPKTLFFRLISKGKKILVRIPLENIDKQEKTIFTEDVLERGIKPIGKRLDSYAKKTAKLCRNIDESCNVIGKDTCAMCAYGWFEVIGHGCEAGGRRYCGSSKCGQRGQPACLKGKMFLEKNNCVMGSKAGFCAPGLTTYCDTNKVLICR